MSKNILRDPNDAPPDTMRAFRELREKVQSMESERRSNDTQSLADSKGVGATVQSLSTQVKDLSERYAVVDSRTDSINTGAIPNDSTFRDHGPILSVQIKSPGIHRQMNVTFGAAQFRVTSVGASATVLAEMTLDIPGVVAVGLHVGRVTATRDLTLGVPVHAVQAFRLPQGTYTVNARMRSWVSSSASTTCEIIFIQPFVMAEIIGAD